MKNKLLLIIFASMAMTGCASTVKPMYAYSDYSETFYAMKKDAGAENEAKWKSSLEDIVEKSKVQSLRVPPGVLANLGYLHLKANDTKKALEYFELEKKVYPESEVFMNNLIKKANKLG